MPLAARRTFRIAAVMGLSLALAYGFGMPLPFLAPLFAILLTATPAAPMGPKSLLGLLVVVSITLGTGLVLAPVLRYYPWSGVMLIAVGLFVSTYLGVGMGKGLVSTLLTIGLTMIPAAALVEHALARSVVQAMLIGIAMAIACQSIVYPFVPEDRIVAPPAKLPETDAYWTAWISLRTMIIVLPPVLMAFTNPSLYMAIIMKAVMLGQQGSAVTARAAGKELLGSTFLAGVFAMAFWFALQAWPTLWMFFLWMLLFGVYVGAKLYGVIPTRFQPSFWVNVGVTMLILIGPAVEDSNGGDVRSAFAQRFFLFVAVTSYAWFAIVVLERLRAGHAARRLRAA
jgi:hypothetical protein